jgi:syntaxin 1B/2/3
VRNPKANPYAADQHELQNINLGQQSTNALSLPEFLGRVDQLQGDLNIFDGSLNEYSRVFQQNLASTDANAEAELKHRLSQMQASIGNIHNGIQLLKQDFTLSLRDNVNPQAKRSHLETLQKNMKALQNRYNIITQRNQQALNQQKTRQYMLVYPNATSEEVDQAVNAEWGNEGVFQTMVRVL